MAPHASPGVAGPFRVSALAFMPQARRPALFAPMLRFGVALSPDAGGSGLGDGGSDAGNDAVLEAAISRVLNKHNNDPNDLAALIVRERGKKDQEIADLKQRLRDAKVPQGSRVLSADEAAEYDAFKALGKPPKDLGEALTAGTAAVDRLSALERDQGYDAAAAALGWRPGLVKSLGAHAERGFTVTWQEEPDPADASKRVRVPYATPKGDGAKPVKLAEYVPATFGDDVADSLAAAGTSGAGTTRTTGTAGSTTPRTAGAQYPPQAGGSTAPQADDPVSRRIAVRNEAATQRPNPFARGSAVRPAPAGAPAA